MTRCLVLEPAAVCGTCCKDKGWQEGFLPSFLGLVPQTTASVMCVYVVGCFGFWFYFGPLNKSPAFCSLYGLCRAIHSVIKTSPAFPRSVVGSGCLSGGGRGPAGVPEAAEQSARCSDPECSDPPVFTEAVSRHESQAASGFAGEGRGRRRRPAANR